jgi:hypothetical protein
MKEELKSLFETQNNLIEYNNSLSISNLNNLNDINNINNSRSISINADREINNNYKNQMTSIRDYINNKSENEIKMYNKEKIYNYNEKDYNKDKDKKNDQPDDYFNNYLPTNDSHIRQNYDGKNKIK